MGKIDTPRPHPNSVVKYRGKAGWSIDQLASIARLDSWTVRMLETGKVKMHIGHITKFSQIFNVTHEEIQRPCVSPRNPQMNRRRSMRNLAAGRGSNKWAGKLPVPDKAPLLVRELYTIMNRDRLMIKDVADGSGVSPATISDWRYTRSPSLGSFEAVLNNIGYKLAIVPQDDDE
jgi:transcriptional regulator with XRE-family HTH domain